MSLLMSVYPGAWAEVSKSSMSHFFQGKNIIRYGLKESAAEFMQCCEQKANLHFWQTNKETEMACLCTQTVQWEHFLKFPVQLSQACTVLGNELEVFSPAWWMQESQAGERGKRSPCSCYVFLLAAQNARHRVPAGNAITGPSCSIQQEMQLFSQGNSLAGSEIAAVTSPALLGWSWSPEG